MHFSTNGFIHVKYQYFLLNATNKPYPQNITANTIISFKHKLTEFATLQTSTHNPVKAGTNARV